jgi:hypothetical protein
MDPLDDVSRPRSMSTTSSNNSSSFVQHTSAIPAANSANVTARITTSRRHKVTSDPLVAEDGLGYDSSREELLAPHSTLSATRKQQDHVSAIGDQRSVVIALRSLQDKIRKLESDRNFHQSECERSRGAHEAYKRDVERQLEHERQEHRRRETELQELIARAGSERARLQESLAEGKSEMGQFHGEFQTLVDKEKGLAREREDRLKAELEDYRRKAAEERHGQEQMIQTVAASKAERDILEATNQRLENTVRDLLAMNTSLSTKQQQQLGEVERSASVKRSTSQQATPRGRSIQSTPRPTVAAPATARGPPRRFESPTMSSINRISSGSRPTYGAPNPRSNSLGARRPSPTTAQHHDPCSAHAVAPLDAVYAGLEQEMRDLNEHYKVIIDEANDPDTSSLLSPEVLTAKLNAVMVQIDRKSEQMRLLRTTKAGVTEDTGNTSRMSVPLGGRPPMTLRKPKGVAKATAKVQIMNDFRTMVRRSAN